MNAARLSPQPECPISDLIAIAHDAVHELMKRARREGLTEDVKATGLACDWIERIAERHGVQI
jgi:hypothetical protein